jgi:hypothetical protein
MRQSVPVNNFDTQVAVSRFLSYRWAAAKFLFCFLSLLSFSTLACGAAGATDVSNAQSFLFGPDLSFSLADFDGDSNPDLASVQAGTSNALAADYWVQLQLSSASGQTFRIVAPAGGVQITSRDVNGDNVPDLVLTRMWTEQPVAILLNDGHGTFSQVDPHGFPEAFGECGASCSSTTDHKTEVLCTSPQSREDICSEVGSKLFLRPRSRVASSSHSRVTLRLFLISHADRAPPFVDSLS